MTTHLGIKNLEDPENGQRWVNLCGGFNDIVSVGNGTRIVDCPKCLAHPDLALHELSRAL